jgi:hypothetical protein
VLAVALVAMAGEAGVYRCEQEDGPVVFTDAPCLDGKQWHDSQGWGDVSVVESPRVRSGSTVSRPVSNPACVRSRAQVQEDVRRYLAARHSGQYSVQKTLLDRTMRAHMFVCSQPAVSDNVAILKRLISRHYPNFSVVRTLYEREIKARADLDR